MHTLYSMRAVALAALTCSLSIASHASDVPTLDYIAAAMQAQNAASVECKFKTAVVSQPKKAGLDYKKRYTGVITADKGKTIDADMPGTSRYIRTPDVLYREDGGLTLWGKRSGTTGIAESCCKMLSKGVTTGQVWQGGASRAWTVMDRIETVVYPVYPRGDDPTTKFLLGWVKYATVCSAEELVDGQQCWRLDITDTGDSGIRHYALWLDPTIGFNPRRFTMQLKRSSKCDLEYTIDSQEYEEISTGIWFPRRQVRSRVADDLPACYQTIYTAVELGGGGNYAADELKPKFDPGTQVVVNTSDGSSWSVTEP
jgi:hypothetical protein